MFECVLQIYLNRRFRIPGDNVSSQLFTTLCVCKLGLLWWGQISEVTSDRKFLSNERSNFNVFVAAAFLKIQEKPQNDWICNGTLLSKLCFVLAFPDCSLLQLLLPYEIRFINSISLDRLGIYLIIASILVTCIIRCCLKFNFFGRRCLLSPIREPWASEFWFLRTYKTFLIHNDHIG